MTPDSADLRRDGPTAEFPLSQQESGPVSRLETLAGLIKAVESNLVVPGSGEVVAFSFSIGAYAGGDLEAVRFLQLTQNPDEYFRNNGKLDRNSLNRLAFEIAKMPEAVPGLHGAVMNVVDRCPDLLLEGAGLSFTGKLFDIFAHGIFLKTLVGDEFIENPNCGFFGRLRDAVARENPQDCDSQKLSEVYSKTYAIYGRNLSLYALRSLEALYMLQSVELDARLCDASGHYAVSGSEIQFPWTNPRMSIAVWKSKFEVISREFSRLRNSKVDKVAKCNPDELIVFLSGRSMEQDFCFSSLSHRLSDRIRRWTERQDRFVENLLVQIEILKGLHDRAR